MAYLFGGIALTTEFQFDQLEPLGGLDPFLRLAIERGAVDAIDDTLVHRSPGRYGLAIGKAAQGWTFRSRFPDTFLFDPERRLIRCDVASAQAQAWQDVLFRRVIPRIATLYGALAIHAAAVATGDRCLLLLGRSGAGKSTLTAFCAQAGWHVLSDDITLVWQRDGTHRREEAFVTTPVQRGMGVWDATRAGLALDDAHCAPMPGYDGKWCYSPPVPAGCEPRALSAILMLERSPSAEAPRHMRLPREAALRLLTAQTVPFVPDAPPDAASAAAFGRTAAMAREVPCFTFTYPDGYATLPQAEAAMRSMPIEDET